MRRGMTAISVLITVALLFTSTVMAGARESRPGQQSGLQVQQAEYPAQQPRQSAPVVPGVVIVALRDGAPQSDLNVQSNGSALHRALEKAGVTGTRPLFPPASLSLLTMASATSGPSSGASTSTSPALAGGSTASVQPGQSEAQARLARVIECSIPLDADPVQVAERLSRDPAVEYAEPKYMHTLYDTPDDPYFPSQAAFTQLNAAAGWSLGKGASTVLIATIDGGTYWMHEDLLPNVRINTAEDANKNGVFDSPDLNGTDEDANGFVDDVVGWNFTNNTPDPAGLSATPLSYSHGTATASHFGAVANNGIGMTGSSWNCALLPVCVASSTGDNLIAYGYEGIVYAAVRGAKVINCSWGRIGGFSNFEQDVITAVTDGGALVVAAAGNDNLNSDASRHYPSNYRGVLGVGATESTSDTRTSFTNYGVSIPVYAPGVNIISALVGGGIGNGGSGTSYSSPLVAGLAGILQSVNPAWTPAQIAAQIRMTADPIDINNPAYSGLLGKGRVNFARALTEAHVGLDVVASTIQSSSGQRFFLPGDTLQVTLTLKNTLFLDATNVAFSAASSNALVQLVDMPGTLGLLQPGQSMQLSPFQFIVGSVTSASPVILRIRWTANGVDADGTALNTWVFPELPQWLMQVDGSDASLFSVHAADKSVVWAAGGNSVGSLPVVVRTTDGGERWNDVTGTLAGVDLYCVYGLDADRAWVGTGDGRIFATADGGATWNVQPYPGRQSPFINGIRMFSDGTGYAQGDPPNDAQFVILKTADFGATWNHLASEPVGTSGEAGWNNSFWWTDQLHGWFGTNHNKVWRTTNGGESWSSASTGSTSSYGVAFRDASTGYAIHENGYVARTTDGGQSWGPVGSPTAETISAVSAVPGSASAWFTTSTASYRTRNDGSAWVSETLFPFVGGLTHLSFADTGTGWVVTSNGEVLKYSSGTPTGVGPQTPTTLPSSVVLDQNYPNPFNGSARITYRVLGSGLSSALVVVYDILGRQIAVLAQGAHAAGEYAVEFDARNRASGVYVYVLEAEPADGGSPVRLSRRMVLVR
jgi:subtilisin family serine protease/photosystem II stability/assembly factor-like uncharacterized protein